MACPLCGSKGAHASRLGTTYYRGREFPYVECAACRTLYCAPMPDAGVLAEMYGPDYTQEGGAAGQLENTQEGGEAGHVENPKEPGRGVEWLTRLAPGTFVDYGCGQGELLTEAQHKGGQTVGVEFSADGARPGA